MFKKILLVGGRFATGLTIKKLLELAFDYGLYPFVLAWLGYVWGGLVMTVAAVIINILIIRVYDLTKVDWLLIEEVKAIREGKNVEGELPKLFKWLSPFLRKGDVIAFFVLCIDDPVTATLYLRKGSHAYNGLDRNEWIIFACANVVSNLYWIIGIAAVFESIKSF